MSAIFISYATRDYSIATGLYTALREKGFDVWYAPNSISTGKNYANEIGAQLKTDEEGDMMKKIDELSASKVLLLILSSASMRSKWVSKEVKLAINQDITVLPLKIDHSELTPEYAFMLSDVQITDAYHLSRELLDHLAEKLSELVPDPRRLAGRRKEEKKLSKAIEVC